MITLSELLKISILESFDVVAGKDHLERTVSSVSVLETPDFEKYVIEHSLILTTLYPIKADQELFKRLLYILKEKNSSGIIIKIHRYIEDIPKDVIELANELDIPMISIEYDANLSAIFNAIISEIQGSEYSKSNLTSFYSEVLKTISDKPSAKELCRSVETIDDLDILIFNPTSEDLYYSSQTIKNYFDQYSNSQSTLVKDGQSLLYLTNVEYQDEVIYRLALLTNKEKRYMLYNYAEIYKMMLIFIFQRKRENFMRQNQFLLSFVSNITSNFNTNEELMEVSKFYDWDVKFPLFLMLFSIKGSHNATATVYAILRAIVYKLRIDRKSVRYVFMDDFVLFIINISFDLNYASTIQDIYDLVIEEYPKIDLKVAYSNPIDYAHDIPKVFAILSKTMNNANRRMIDLKIYNENHVRLITLLKSLNYEALKEFSQPIIGRLLEHEKKTNLPLINTIYKYIQCRFSVTKTAEALFIHPNSLKYRLGVAEKLGYQFDNDRAHFFDLYLALYVYVNLMEVNE